MSRSAANSFEEFNEVFHPNLADNARQKDDRRCSCGQLLSMGMSHEMEAEHYRRYHSDEDNYRNEYWRFFNWSSAWMDE